MKYYVDPSLLQIYAITTDHDYYGCEPDFIDLDPAFVSEYNSIMERLIDLNTHIERKLEQIS